MGFGWREAVPAWQVRGGPGRLKETELSVPQSSEAAFAVITDKLIKLLLKVMETAYL